MNLGPVFAVSAVISFIVTLVVVVRMVAEWQGGGEQ